MKMGGVSSGVIAECRLWLTARARLGWEVFTASHISALMFFFFLLASLLFGVAKADGPSQARVGGFYRQLLCHPVVRPLSSVVFFLGWPNTTDGPSQARVGGFYRQLDLAALLLFLLLLCGLDDPQLTARARLGWEVFTVSCGAIQFLLFLLLLSSSCENN